MQKQKRKQKGRSWPEKIGYRIFIRNFEKNKRERGIEMKCGAQNCISTTRSKISAV